MKLTEETLKMARISGLDYAESTDYMTNALRSFKMEMQDAGRIVDVYSAIAAKTATDVEELAQAMSKTASSAEAVGSSFENTTAMMAVMIEATRQAPENIGSALKSIISRYGQLKVNPNTLVDSEGQVLSLNKVDTALQSVGISIHDAQGQFRNFDDVIMDLAKSWDTIDKNTQRYIATVMAGNRQQSRFLALVSSYERLKETAEIAANSQNAAQLQYLKTLDSIEAKQQQLQTSMQSLYTSTGIQNFYKTLIDLGNSVIQSFTDIPTILNLPIPALLKFGTTFYNIATLVTQMYSMLRARINVQTKAYEGAITANLELEAAKRQKITQEEYDEKVRAAQAAADKVKQIERGITTNLNEQAALRQKHKGMISSAVGMVATLGATVLPTDTAGQRGIKGLLTGIGGLAQGIGTGLMMGGPAGAIMGVLTALPAAIEGIGIAIETTEEKIERYDKAIQDANNKKLISENELKTLTDYRKKFEELEEHQNDSNQAKQEFLALNAEIAANYPSLISKIDNEGNVIVKLGQQYEVLAQKKRAAYADNIIDSTKKQLQAASDTQFILKQLNVNPENRNKTYGLNQNSQLLDNTNKALSFISPYASAEFLRTLGYDDKNYADAINKTKAIIDDYRESIKDDQAALIEFNTILEQINIDDADWSFEDLTRILNILSASFGNTEKLYDAFVGQGVQTDVTEYVQNVSTYSKDFIDGIITSSIAQLRQSYDAIWDKQNKVSGLAGTYMNKQLIDSYKAYATYRRSQGDTEDTIWENWSKGTISEEDSKTYSGMFSSYDQARKIIYDSTNKAFEELDEYYQDIGNLTIEQYNKIVNKYSKDPKAKEAWDTFEAEFIQVKEQADKIFHQAIGRPVYYEYSANTKKRIAALKNKDNINLERFTAVLEGQDEEGINSILNIIESGTTDSISGIEDIIKKYGETFNVNPETDYDVFVKIMRQFEDTVRINFNTEYQTLAESYTSHLKEFDKALKNATSGMGYEDAVALANQLGVTLGQFQQREGKFYLDNLNIIKNKLMPGQDGLKQVLQNRAKIVEQVFDKNGDIISVWLDQQTEQALSAWPSELQQVYSAIQGFKNSGKELTLEGWKKYIAQLQSNFNELDKATQYIIQSNWLATGNLDKFLSEIKDGSKVDKSQLYTKALKGELTGELAQFSQQIIELYQKNTKAVYDAVTNLISGQSISESVVVTDTNKGLLEKILGEGSIDESKIGQVIQIPAEKAAENFDETLYSLLGDQSYNWKARIEAAGKLWEGAFSGSNFRLDALKSAINSSFQDLDFATWGALPDSIRTLADYNTTTGKFFMSLNQAAQVINAQSLIDEGFTKQEANELIATLRKNTREKDIKTIASELVKNRESLTEENISSIATALGQTYDEVIATLQLQRNQDGTYRMNMNSILQLMNQKKGQLDSVLAQMIAEEIDNIIGNVSNIASNQGKGVTSYAEMQKATSRAQQAGFDVDISNLYEWNDTIHGFVLSAEGILVEVARARMEFESLSAENKEARQLLQEQIESMGRQLANSIDINAFMQAENKNPGSEAAKTLIKGIDDYNSYLRAIGQTTLLDADKLIQNLRHGGQEAVSALTAVARLQGRELNKQEIETAYRASVERLLAIGQELTAGAGEIISKDTAQKLQKHTQAKLKNLGNGSYLVLQAAENLTLAYLNLYSELARSGQATLAELNNTAAQYYNSREGAKKGQLLDMLSNSAEMTYNQLAEMFTAAGWKFTTDTIDQLGNNILKLNNGRVRINNFKGFADALGINTDSPEYLEAFKSYNDALIKESQFVEKTINDELNNLVKAKPGDLINISGLYTKVGDMLEVELMTAGVQFNNGIVKITEATNLPALIQSIESAAAAQGLILESDVQALIDAVQALFKGLADSITKGIQGTLSKTEAMDLQSSARNLLPGFNGELKFTQTYNGLRLSTDQAIKLYDAMKSVDTVSAHIVFDSLTKQLTKAGEACESMSRAMAEIARLENKVKQSTGDARKEAEKQLAVYKQIANTQIQNPESYDWMNRDLPDYLKGPENYWNSLGTAFKALNEAAKEAEEGSTKAAHMLDPTDFYNMVNEFNNIAQLSGTEINFLGHKLNGDMTSAAKLIEEGIRTLSNVDGDGVKVDLTKFGANFTGGAEGMAKGVHEGIRAMAKSQIEMLDGMIQLLETVVAMQQLGDITNGDGQIDLNDLFPDITGEDGYKLKAGKITEWANSLLGADKESDLGKALDSVKFGTKTLRELLAGATSDVGLAKDDAIALQKAMDALWQMYQSGDYSLQNLIGSIQQVLAGSGYEGQVDIGTTSFYVKGDYILQKGKDGWEVPGVGSFEDENKALKAYMLKEKTGATNISFTEEGQAFSTIDIGGQKVRVETTINGVEYNVNGKNCNSYNQAAQQAYKQYVKQFRIANSADAIPLSEEQWRVQLNVPLESSVNITNETQVKTAVQNATHEQIVALSKALASGDAKQIETAVIPFKIDYKAEGQTSALQSDIDKIANLAGIDTKTMALSLTTEIISDNDNIKKIFSNENLSATVDLTGNLTNLDGTQNTLTYDEQVSVTLANIKAMATAESINWDGITALINTVPEDKRPTVEAQAKQYIIKALEGNPEYQGFPALLTGLQGLPIPALQATATVMSILWGGDKATNATGLTEEKVNALAAELPNMPTAMLKVLATLVQITDGGVVPEESQELATKLSQLFPDGKYTTNDIKAITLAATAAAVMINGKGVTATGEFDDSYQTTNGIAQVTADIIKLIVSTNASTTTEEGTTFNADNWQGTVDKIYAVAALLEVGLQNEADINVDGMNIPSNVATTKTIEALRASASVLSVIFQEDPTGKNINVEEVDKVIAELEQQEKIQASDIDSIKAIVASILFKPKDDNMQPQGLDTLIPKDTDGAYNAGKLTVKYQTEVEFTDSAEEAYKALRDQLYTLSQGTNAGLYETWGNTSFANSQTGVTTFLDQLLDKVVNKGHILTRAEQNILNNYKTAIEAAPEELANNFKQINMTIDALIDENDLNISNQQEQFSILSQTFSQLDSTTLQECATAMAELAENAKQVQSIPWDIIVSSINEINGIETPDAGLLDATTIVRTISANISLDYGGDDVAAEVLPNDTITRDLIFHAKIDNLQQLIQSLDNTLNIDASIGATTTTTTTTQTVGVNYDDSGLEAAEKGLSEVTAAADSAAESVEKISGKLYDMPADTAEKIEGYGTAARNTGTEAQQAGSSLRAAASRAASSVSGLASSISKLQGTHQIDVNLRITATEQGATGKVKGSVNGQELIMGTPTSISLMGASKATGNAAAQGKTLVGQLGPELVVSNGRYYLVGQAGAQMVSLPDDAIVFNHLQTQNLLKKERGGGRGKPVTNERNAVAFAKGTGPAMASASAALAALKQIRAMWQSMLGATMKDLGSLAGQEAGKASSGGGGGGSNDPEQVKAVVAQIERWYNLLRQINRLQKEITYEENLQAEIESDRLANGKARYNSYKREIEYLDEEIVRNQQLADLQKSWYERKRQELVNSDYGKIFTYDENGQLQYRQGANRGLDVLETLTRRDIYGRTTGASTNAQTQINYLRSIGFNTQKLKYNDDGTVLSESDYEDNPEQIYVDMMQNFWDNLDGWKDELDGIYDSYQDQLNNVLTNQTKRNQLLQKIIDNQLSVEQDVLKAIESREQKLIDELQDERDALEKSNKDFIDGLTDQLNQQKQMYQNAESEKELVKLRRQVAILQRSGGSASQIRSLQEQIAAKEQDQYFTAQEQQIAAIQKASDLQIERMDSQIDLMTKTLEYQKQHGLLWEEVYQVMAATPQQIRQFITENTPDFQSASALDVAEKIRDIDLRINEWIGYRDDETAPSMTGDRYYDWDSYSAARTEVYGSRASDQLKNQAKEEFDRILQETGDINAAGAAADAIFRAVLGDRPGLSDIKDDIIDGIATNITDKINGDVSNITKPSNYPSRDYDYGSSYNYNRNNYINNNKTVTNKNTSTTDSKKTSWTFTTNQTQEEIQAIQEINKLNQRIFEAERDGKQSLLTQNLEKKRDALRKKYLGYSSGGLVDYTGLAQVDGTPQRPEAFINAEQTQMLRDYLFGGSNSLLSLAQQIVQQMHGTSSGLNTNNITEQSGLNIEKIDVNVNVDRVANDYDVRQIGGKVMDEILTIARKSGTRGLSRR